MQQSSRNSYIGGAGGTPGGGPRSFLGRILAFIVGLGVFAVAIFLGAIFIAAVLGFMLIAGLVVAGRVWWVKRKMERYQREHGDLEADYVEIKDASPRDRD